MSDKPEDRETLSRRAALKKLGIGTVAFVAPTVMTVSEAKADKRTTRSRSRSKSRSSCSESRSKSRTKSDTYSYES